MFDFIKANPVKVITGTIAVFGSLVSSVLFAEERYNQKSQVQLIQTDIHNLRHKDLEDKIFILNFKKASGDISPLDDALLKRYEAELNN